MTKNIYRNRLLVFTAAVVAVWVALSSCKKNVVSEPYTDYGYQSFKGSGSFADLTPAPAVASNGKTTFTARFDNNSRILNYTVTWDSLSSPATKADFYFPSTLTQNGLLLRNMFTGQTYATSSSFTWYIWGVSGLSDEELAVLKAGKAYYILCTQANPAGEVRGQITVK